MIKKNLYNILAKVLCIGICRGKCCGDGVMNFQQVGNGIIKYIHTDSSKVCIAFNLRWRTCKKHKDESKLDIGQKYKCNKLNYLSFLFNQPLWRNKL